MPQSRTSLSQLFGELAEGQRVLVEALDMPEHELQATETLVLALLEAYGQRTPTDLARLTGLSRGRITHLTTALIDRGHVVKRPDHADRRRSIVTVTADGREVAASALRRVEQLQQRLVSALGAAGVDMLAQQLAALRAIGESAQD